MGEVLFVTWDGGGNVPPAVGVATELRRRGHGVRFLGHRSQADAFAQAGLAFRAFSQARPFASSTPSSTSTLLGVFADRAMGEEVCDEVAARPAEVVVVDCLLFGVMRALRARGLGYVTLEHSFDGYFRRAAKGPMGLLLRLRGTPALKLLDAGQPVLAATLAELDTGHGDVVHTGPVLATVPSCPGSPERPAVLLSLSTFAFSSLVPTWQRVLDAVDGLPARVIATTGPAVDPGLLRFPPNVEHHRWLPHDEVLSEVSLVVGHGGHATTMRALAHDVPLVVVPLDAKTDQPAIGKAVQRAGAGRVLGRRSSPARLRAAIEELLADGPHRAAAAGLGAAIRARPGAVNAADQLELLLSGETKQPGSPGPGAESAGGEQPGPREPGSGQPGPPATRP